MINHNVSPWEVCTKSLSVPSENSLDVLPLRMGHDLSQVRGIWIKKHLYGPPRPKSLKVGPSTSSTTATCTLRVRDGKGWAHKRPIPRRTSAMVISAHDRVSARYDPWFFPKTSQGALKIGRTYLRTIWIDRYESKVGHQADPSRIPTNGMSGPHSN